MFHWREFGRFSDQLHGILGDPFFGRSLKTELMTNWVLLGLCPVSDQRMFSLHLLLQEKINFQCPTARIKNLSFLMKFQLDELLN